MALARVLHRVCFLWFAAASLAAFGAMKVLTRLARVGRRPVRVPPRRILLLPHDPPAQSGTRYRFLAWAERLGKRGVRVDVGFPLTDGEMRRLYGPSAPRMEWLAALTFARRFRQVIAAARYDAVIVGRNAFPRYPYGGPVMDRLLAAVNPRTFLDLDDAIWAYPAPPRGRGPAAALLRRLTDTRRPLRAMALVHGVLAGNAFLLARARRTNPNARLLPTCVDPDRVPVRRHAPSARPVVGWIGTPGNLRHLDLAAPALARLAGRRRFVLRVVSSRAWTRPGVPVENAAWSAEREAREVAAFDVGIMPLIPGPAAEGKCGLKLLQYAAAGVPAVASPVGVNREIVRPGETGFLAAGDAEWEEALDRLLGDHRLRARLGAAARDDARRRWSYDAWEPALLDALGLRSGRSPWRGERGAGEGRASRSGGGGTRAPRGAADPRG